MQVKTIKTHWQPGQLKHNTYIVEGARSSIVIDAGCPLEELKQSTNLPISVALLTHAHIDHIEYIEDYDKDNIQICGSKKTYKMLADNVQNLTTYFNRPKQYKVKNYAVVNDGDKIILNDFEITVMATPGHTEDSTTYIVTDGKETIVFAGDTVFSVAVGSTGFDTSSVRDLIKSLKKIDKLEYNMLYSGHGGPSTKENQTKNIDHWLQDLQP